MRKTTSLLLISLVLLFTGCVSPKTDQPQISDTHTNFNRLADRLLQNIYPKLNELGKGSDKTKSIYVTDFVNLHDLENNSRFGFLLSEEVKALVTQKTNIAVHEIEFTKYLKVGPNGTKLLSRNLKELKETSLNPYTYALVGTYVITKKQVIIYTKLISLKNGVILKSSSKNMPITQELLELNGIELKSDNVKEVPIYQPVVL